MMVAMLRNASVARRGTTQELYDCHQNLNSADAAVPEKRTPNSFCVWTRKGCRRTWSVLICCALDAEILGTCSAQRNLHVTFPAGSDCGMAEIFARFGALREKEKERERARELDTQEEREREIELSVFPFEQLQIAYELVLYFLQRPPKIGFGDVFSRDARKERALLRSQFVRK